MAIKKEVKRIDKKGKKSQKPYPTGYNILIAQDLWQALYQILLIILFNEFTKLNVNTAMMKKIVRLIELNTKIVSAALNT